MNSHNRLRYYGQTEHTLWIDEYPLRGRSFDEYTHGPGGILSLENANRISVESGSTSVWNMNQVFSHTGPGLGPRFATPAEHRLGNFISLATGGRTLQYFSMTGYLPHAMKKKTGYKLGKRIIGFGTPVGAPMLPAGREVFKQGPIPPTYGPLLMPTIWDHKRELPVSCPDLSYKTVSKNKKALGYGLNVGKEYDVLVVYNRDTLQAQSGTIGLTEVLRGRDVYDLFTSQQVAHDRGRLSTGTLEAGGGRMYLIATAASFEKVRLQVVVNKYNLRKRLFDFYYREQRNNGLDMGGLDRVFTQKFADVKAESALSKLDSAYARLKARELGKGEFAHTHLLLKSAQADFVAIAELQAKYLSRPTVAEINALVDTDPYQQWHNEAVKLSDVYVLLRNLLYFGRPREALPLARELVPLMAAQLKANRDGVYASVGEEHVNALHREALDLNDFDLLKALKENVK
ncbi:MAG: hypothetical protein HN380_21320 [Victivallales bacterium]|nr:hypothetical protein [Victivallales bacterium]